MQVNPKSAPLAWRGVVPFDGGNASATCEVLVRGRWAAISIDIARGLHPDRMKRCCDCQGELRLITEEVSGLPAALVHRHAHGGCPRDGTFTGRPSRHPKRLT